MVGLHYTRLAEQTGAGRANKHMVGTYVLRIRVTQAVSIVQHMRKEKPIVHIPPGEYCYVGSGHARHAGLGRRLLRHATRFGSHPPQAIREMMVESFRRIRLDCGAAVSTRQKNPGAWFVEYLLDHPQASLKAVYAIRENRKLEQRVGRLVESDPVSSVIKLGLGGGEFKGKLTLFHRMETDEKWWRELPERLARCTVAEELSRLYSPTLVEGPVEDGRLTTKMMVELKNMWSERAITILRWMWGAGMGGTTQLEKQVGMSLTLGTGVKS